MKKLIKQCQIMRQIMRQIIRQITQITQINIKQVQTGSEQEHSGAQPTVKSWKMQVKWSGHERP